MTNWSKRARKENSKYERIIFVTINSKCSWCIEISHEKGQGRSQDFTSGDNRSWAPKRENRGAQGVERGGDCKGEGWRLGKDVPLPNRPGSMRKRRELPQQGPGLSPGRQRFWHIWGPHITLLVERTVLLQPVFSVKNPHNWGHGHPGSSSGYAPESGSDYSWRRLCEYLLKEHQQMDLVIDRLID